jgi:hypothetical protein
MWNVKRRKIRRDEKEVANIDVLGKEDGWEPIPKLSKNEWVNHVSRRNEMSSALVS